MIENVLPCWFLTRRSSKPGLDQRLAAIPTWSFGRILPTTALKALENTQVATSESFGPLWWAKLVDFGRLKLYAS